MLLMPRVPSAPRSCQMDECATSTQNRFLIQSLYLQKTSGQGVRMHPPMILLAMVKRGRYESVGLLLGIWRLPSFLREGLYIVP